MQDKWGPSDVSWINNNTISINKNIYNEQNHEYTVIPAKIAYNKTNGCL